MNILILPKNENAYNKKITQAEEISKSIASIMEVLNTLVVQIFKYIKEYNVFTLIPL